MIKFLSHPAFIFALIFAAALLYLGAGCSPTNPYVGPTVATVGITGSYGDREGNTYGGGINVGLNPPPTPTPKPVVASK